MNILTYIDNSGSPESYVQSRIESGNHFPTKLLILVNPINNSSCPACRYTPTEHNDEIEARRRLHAINYEVPAMAKIVSAVFETNSNAQLAAQDLLNHGIYREDISIQMTQGSNGREFCVDIASKAPEGGVVGTICGAILGAAFAYLVAGGYITVEGIHLARHGLLVSSLAGCGAGALIGMLCGWATGALFPEYESNMYPVDRRTSRILMGVYCNEKRENEVRTLLLAASGSQLRSRSVATEPIRLYTTTVTHKADEEKDDLMSHAIRANEGAAMVKRLQLAKINLTKIMDSIARLESDLAPVASQWDANAKAKSAQAGTTSTAMEGKSVADADAAAPVIPGCSDNVPRTQGAMP